MPIDRLPIDPAPTQSALLLLVPEAESALSPHRRHYDAAARVGVPAHLTIAYPFKPPADLTEHDLQRLRGLISTHAPFDITFSTTGWFGDEVLFLDPDDPTPLHDLIHDVGAAFPDFPIYGGAHAEVHPHVTIGHSVARHLLETAELSVVPSLPITQRATELQLWQGYLPTSGLGTWAQVATFELSGS